MNRSFIEVKARLGNSQTEVRAWINLEKVISIYEEYGGRKLVITCSRHFYTIIDEDSIQELKSVINKNFILLD